MPKWTIKAGHHEFFSSNVVVEAGTLEEACAEAIALLNDDVTEMVACGEPSTTFIDRIAEGELEDPYEGEPVEIPPGHSQEAVYAAMLNLMPRATSLVRELARIALKHGPECPEKMALIQEAEALLAECGEAL